jgi:hypothetical protein
MPTTPWSLVAPSQDNSQFAYRLRTAGGDVGAYLTYELSAAAQNDRSLLLVTKHPAIWRELDPADKENLSKLESEVLGRQRSRGVFHGTKSLVNELHAGQLVLPNTRVAVHRFGAVPVYVLPAAYIHQRPAGTEDYKVGIYPHRLFPYSQNPGKYANLPVGSNSAADFLSTLRIDLHIQMRRYFEDIAEHLHDIEHHSGLSETFRRAKDVARILSESIEPKLDCVWRGLRATSAPSARSLAKDIVDRFGDWLAIATYGKSLTRVLLNDLYKHIGLGDSGDRYKEEFLKLDRELSRRLASSGADVLEQTPLIDEIRTTFAAYTDEHAAYEKLKRMDISERWLRRYMDFARFLAFLREMPLSPAVPRVFISSHLDVPVADTVRRLIESYVERKIRPGLSVLAVHSKRPSTSIGEVIRSRIWLSDSIKAIIPRDTTPITDDREKDYLWVAREIEHGLLLNKRIVTYIESGTDPKKVTRDFANDNMGFLSPHARIDGSRTARIVDAFDGLTRTEFRLESGDSLPASIRDCLEREVEQVRDKRANDLLNGYVAMFPRDLTGLPFLLAHRHVFPSPKRVWVRQLMQATSLEEDEAARKFDNFIRLARKYVLRIGAVDYRFVRTVMPRQLYDVSVSKILRALRPDLRPNDLAIWESKLYARYVSEVA